MAHDIGLHVTLFDGYLIEGLHIAPLYIPNRIDNVTHNRHYSLVYLLGITRPTTTRERIENCQFILHGCNSKVKRPMFTISKSYKQLSKTTIHVTGGRFCRTGPLACLSPFPVWYWIRSDLCLLFNCFLALNDPQ